MTDMTPKVNDLWQCWTLNESRTYSSIQCLRFDDKKSIGITGYHVGTRAGRAMEGAKNSWHSTLGS